MDEKTRELIAVGAAVTAHCVTCLKYHVAQARKAGASDADITEAVRMGRKVRAGAANVWDEETANALPPPAPTTDAHDPLPRRGRN